MTTCRLGKPKLTFDAPHVVLTFSSSRSRRMQAEHLLTGLAEGADRHHERIDDDVVGGDAVVGGAVDDALGDLEAHVGIHR